MIALNNPCTNDIELKATRDGYGQGLVDLAQEHEKIVVLDADLSGSTKTNLFAKKYPKRFFNFGVAEQNMVGHAAGLSIAGFIPVASSFSIFLIGRAWEIVRNSIAYPNLNVTLAGTHAGITLGEDGASHQIIEDIALMRAIPNMNVLVPSDYWQAYQAIRLAISIPSPVYIRLGRPKRPVLYTKNIICKLGQGNVIQEGKKYAFFAIGVMVYEAWKAARMLEEKYKIRPWVVDMFSVKPLDTQLLLHIAKQADHVVTFEEHNILAGFGSAVSEILSTHCPKKITYIGINDQFGQSAPADVLMSHYHLTAEKIVQKLEKDII